MKRILRSCLFVFFLLFIGKIGAQCTLGMTFSLSPNEQCFNSNGTYTMDAGLFVQSAGANNYQWTITPLTATCAPTFTFGQHTTGINTTNTGSQVAITFPCCGTFSIVVAAFFNNGTQNIPTGAACQTIATIYCPTGGGSVTVSPSVACIQSTVAFSGIGGASAASYSWSNGTNGVQTLVITPTVNTCLTYTATTANGCTISPPAACVSVQSASLILSPLTQSICANSPICLTSTALAVNNGSTTPGTAITSTVSWFDPNGLSVTGCTTSAVNGNYTATVEHTGAAGTCTYAASVQVFTSAVISVTATASQPSVCPGASVQLTGVSVQTVASSYTWTSPTTTTFSGNPWTRNNFATLTNPAIYTVNVNYFGCPGTATVAVGMLTLTPTLTPNSFSICPGTAVTLTATGGQLYTFRYWNPGPPGAIIGFANSPTSVRSHTPASLGAVYSVTTTSNGCTGSATISIGERTLFPTLTSSSQSICPGSEFTLSASGVAAANYTFLTPYAPNSYITPQGDTLIHTIPPPGPPYTYTVQADSAGCKGSATLTVGLLTLNTTLTPSTYSICPGTAFSMTASPGAGTTYTFRGPPNNSSIYQGSVNVVTHFATTNPALPHKYYVVSDSAGCKGSDTIMIYEKDLGPNINFTVSPSLSICPGQAFTVTASAASGTNNFNYIFVGPTINDTISQGPPSNTASTIPATLSPPPTYTIIADSSTCRGEKSFTIFERKLFPFISVSNSLVCAGMPVTVTASGPGFTTTTQYTFATIVPTPSILTGGGPTFSYVVHNPTVQTVYSVLVEDQGCTAAYIPTIAVNIRPDLVLTPAASAASVCPGTAATINITGPTPLTAPISYTSWTQIAGTGSLMPGPVLSGSAQVFPVTNSTYSINAIDSLGCIGNTTISVGVDPTISFPLVVNSSGSTICAQQSVALSTSQTITTIGSLSYTWSPNVGTLTSVNGPTIGVSPSVTTTYSVVVTNPYGCASGNTIIVPVGQYPTVTIVPTASQVCHGFTSTLTAFGANSYTWSGISFSYQTGSQTIPSQTIGPIQQQAVSVAPGTYTVIGSNGGSCISVSTTVVHTLAPLSISITASSATTCIESNNPKFSKPVNLEASGGASYAWYPYINMTYSLGPKTDVRPPASTCYTVIGSTAICSGTGQICVNVIPQFSFNVVPPLPAICVGDSLKLQIANIGTLAVGAPAAFTYSWTEADNAPPISISNNLGQSVTVFPQNTTTYSVEIADTRKCMSLPRLVTVTVLPQPVTSIAIPTINSVATNSVCYVGLNPGPNDVTINLTAVNGNTNLQFGVVPTYTWLSPYKGSTSILTPPNSPAVTVNAPVRLPSVAVYTVLSGYNGIPGCRVIDTVSVRVFDCRPVRDVKFTTVEDNDTICARSCITFVNLTDTMAGGPQKVSWSFPGGSPNTSTLSMPTVCYNLPNAYNVILKVENPYPILNPNGIPGSSRTIGSLNYIKVVDIPNVTIVPPGQSRSDTTVRFGTALNLTGTGAKTYEWSPNYNISSLTNPKVTVSPFRTTQYILTGYNSKGCSSSDTLNVMVVEDCGEMYVPNAFTPNADGANDVLYVRGICLQSVTFMIFNRWGEKIFETNDQKIGWDGTYKGEEMNTGVFVYRLEGKTYDGKGFSSKGNITLIR